MQNRSPISLSKSSSGFTLIELIVVIIIVGILAALGISQYSKMVEKGRGTEARMILGQMRKVAYEYWLQNATTTGMTNADLNVGSGTDQIPSPCRNTHYFRYGSVGTTGDNIDIYGYRCDANGKTPQGDASCWIHIAGDIKTAGFASNCGH